MIDCAILPPTAAELADKLQHLKERVLKRIASHFAAYPAPVNNIDRSAGTSEYLPLLAYHVTTTEESHAFITELRADGFRYETHSEKNGRENYATLDVEELIDLVRVLENTRD